MLGFLKNLLGKNEAKTAAPAAATQQPVAVPAPAVPVTKSPSKKLGEAPSLPRASTGAGISRGKGKMERVLIPLRLITDNFPPELASVIAAQPAESVIVALPIESIISQLPQGRVQIAIAELRRVAPVGIFVSDTSRDEAAVDISLPELLSRLDPTLLQRRTQKRVELPNDIAGVFAKQGSEPAAPAPQTVTPPAAVRPTFPAQPPSPSVSERQAEPTPKPSSYDLRGGSGIKTPEPQRPTMPERPAAQEEPEPTPMPTIKFSLAPEPEVEAPKPATPTPQFGRSSYRSEEERPPVTLNFAPSEPEVEKNEEPPAFGGLKLRMDAPAPEVAPSAPAPTQAPSIPPSFVPPVAPVAREVHRPVEPEPVKPAPAPKPEAPKVEVKPEPPVVAPQPVPVPVATAPTPAPIPAGETVSVPAAKVSGNWPAHILAEVSALGPDVAFLIPTSELGAALKRGKASFTWQQLCAWMATPPTTGTSYGEQNLDLPLPVIAPLFLASMKPARPQQRVTVDETIPDPFSAMAKGPKPGEAAAAPQPAAPEASGLPAEIVGRVASLSGVAGAVIALKEGLLVAHKVPNELNPETVAAFVPQVFSRVEQSTSVMEIGDLQNLSFTAGDRPWQIWKAGALFFAVMGRPNELLPSAQIKIYAAQLARQSKG